MSFLFIILFMCCTIFKSLKKKKIVAFISPISEIVKYSLLCSLELKTWWCHAAHAILYLLTFILTLFSYEVYSLL